MKRAVRRAGASGLVRGRLLAFRARFKLHNFGAMGVVATHREPTCPIALQAQTVDALLVGIEATGSMQWFLNLMDELQVLLRVSD